MKFSRIAGRPRKPRKLRPSKICTYTVCVALKCSEKVCVLLEYYKDNMKIAHFKCVVLPITASVGGRHTSFTETENAVFVYPLQSLTGEILQFATACNEDGDRVDVSASGFWEGKYQKAFLMSKCLMLLMHLCITVPKYPHFIDILNMRNNGSMKFFYSTCIFNIKGMVLVFSRYGSCCCCILWKTSCPCLSSEEVVMSWLHCRIS